MTSGGSRSGRRWQPSRRCSRPCGCSRAFDVVRQLSSVDKNWAALRAVVATETGCIVRHLGVLLKDANFAIDGNKTLEADKTVSFLKCRMLSELIMRVNTMQLGSYKSSLQTVDEYEAFITDVIDVACLPADASADEQKYTSRRPSRSRTSSATRSPPAA